MADQMPTERQIRQRVDLRQSFLHFVFAKVGLSGCGCGADEVGGECFRNGDETDRGGSAPGAAGGPRDARADVRQPIRNRVEQRYLGRLCRMFLAVAAFGPVGASFKYVSNSLFAPAMLPSFTSAMPS